ncbi:hypothetical protein RchiOBHm_Chr5g0071601 [Rosa chinensis]|uniref:Uncharacterized protein n=1 Tax=Rosa chinensis TaxID=74649 RepID=A0A2P6QKG3_ROSCH|nr:hypothetical protein RchiOBHm_Chr5g0071601 [Rosa chinensis]
MSHLVGHYRFTSNGYSWDGLFLGHGEKLDLTLGYKVCLVIWGQRNQLTR